MQVPAMKKAGRRAEAGLFKKESPLPYKVRSGIIFIKKRKNNRKFQQFWKAAIEGEGMHGA